MFKVIDHTDCIVLEMFSDFDSAFNYCLDISIANPSHCYEVVRVGSSLGVFVMDGESH